MCVFTACNKAEPTAAESTAATTTAATTTAATTTAVSTTAATTTTAAATTTETTEELENEESDDDSIYPIVAYQVYTDDSTIEYIELGADFEAYTPGMIETNDAIADDVFSRITQYEEHMDDDDFRGGILIYAYSMTDENYIQIYNTVLEYPTYGTAGDLFGFVYDIENDDYITLEEFFDQNGLSGEALTEEIVSMYNDTNPTDTVGAVILKAFNLIKGPDGDYAYSILFEMETTPEKADEPYKGFYSYSPFDNDVIELNSEQLFDPYSVDWYDEPLEGQPESSEYSE
jgi:hypothetical protein